MLFAALAQRIVEWGRLEIIDAHGRHHRVDNQNGPEVAIRLRDPALHRRLIVNPQLALGEAYMEGGLTIERGRLYDFLDICARAELAWSDHLLGRSLYALRRLMRRLHQYNPAHRAQAHVAHHYDLSDELYDLFLDADRQYSCAYFRSDSNNLEQAQRDKKRHLAAKLHLTPGQRVLDIGSGWGGLALHLAEAGAGEVLGVTLSEEQLKYSRARAERAGFADRVHFRLCDYRELTGQFDRIVSVGMFEHVGVNHYVEFFNKIKSLLDDDGLAVLHSIGRMDGPGATNPWIRKYIFPGGYSPALSEVLPIIESRRLWVADIEILRLHYAETLRHWRKRFAANRARVKALYDERFCRMWEFYLAGSELAFRHGGHMVFQIQLAKRQDAAPLIRDYISDWERRGSDEAVAAE
jgi:cyclopropane-fatty-acyl-phospholipid synthase